MSVYGILEAIACVLALGFFIWAAIRIIAGPNAGGDFKEWCNICEAETRWNLVSVRPHDGNGRRQDETYKCRGCGSTVSVENF